uniref:Uncharacterized protein n=1 Tax=Amphiprion percula TaxID=161767 RepID=A0A3P8SBP7_AMPPE
TTNAAASDCSLWRGRPRSVGTSSHPDNSDNSVKRGRGRPKGSKKVVSNDGTPRKRGRPKLNKTVGKSGEDLPNGVKSGEENGGKDEKLRIKHLPAAHRKISSFLSFRR